MASSRIVRMLVTGFDSFPGMRKNPSADLVRALGEHPASALRLSGAAIRTRILPVTWSRAGEYMRDAIEGFRPDVVLCVGAAARRARLTVEIVSKNRRTILRPDAEGRCAASTRLRRKGPSARRARVRTGVLAQTLRRRGAACDLSRDAGDYLCNEVFDVALGSGASIVAFIHIPRLRNPFVPLTRRKASRNHDLLSREQAAKALSAALMALALEETHWASGSRPLI